MVRRLPTALVCLWANLLAPASAPVDRPPGMTGRTEWGKETTADERVYDPLHVEPYTVEPYTSAPLFAAGRVDSAFRTKPQIAVELVRTAVAAGVPFRAVIADFLYWLSQLPRTLVWLDARGWPAMPRGGND